MTAGAVGLFHLTDTHLFADPPRELRGVDTDESLRRVLADYAASGRHADAVLLSGDIVQDDSREAYRHCRRHLTSLALPVYVCPGNHDVPTLLREELDGEPFRHCGVHRLGAWTLITLDSHVAGRTSGQLDDDQLQILDDGLSSCDGLALVALHHPPVPLGSRWADAVGLENADEFRRTIAGRAQLVLFGHAHQAYDGETDGVRYAGTPSTCRQFKPGTQDFEVDDRPPAWRWVELAADGSVNLELHWID